MANQVRIKDQLVSVGDLVRVSTLLIEGGKSRLSLYEGLVIAIKGREENRSFTVRRIGAAGIGVERGWPINSPWIKKIEILKSGRVRRAKLYFLRQRKGRLALKVKTRDKIKISPKAKVKKIQVSKLEKEPKVVREKARRTGRKTRQSISSG